MQDMEQNNGKYKVNPAKFKFDMTNFLNRFAMYKGIQQFYLHSIAKEKKRIEMRQKRKPDPRVKLDTKGLTAQDNTLIQQIKCDPSWSTCFFDFTHMVNINDHFVYKVGKPASLDLLIIDNYFGQANDDSWQEETWLRSNPDDLNLEEQKSIVPAASPTRSISPRHIELPSTGISMIS
jgi:hypothetical protein